MSDIDVNAIADVLNNKVDLPVGKNQSDIDYIVESQLPTLNNSYTWYRLYKSGWVEQGGRFASSNSITYPKTMQDIYYCLQITSGGPNAEGTSIGSSAYAMQFDNKTVSGFTPYNYQNGYPPSYWYVCGMTSQGGS